MYNGGKRCSETLVGAVPHNSEGFQKSFHLYPCIFLDIFHQTTITVRQHSYVCCVLYWFEVGQFFWSGYFSWLVNWGEKYGSDGCRREYVAFIIYMLVRLYNMMKCKVSTCSALRRVSLCSQDELVTSAGLLFPSLFLNCPNALKTWKFPRFLLKAASRNRTGYHTFYFWKYNISLHFIFNDMITPTSSNKEFCSWQWHNRTTGKNIPCLSRRMFIAVYTADRC
jgi:hypothetical protein